MPNNIHSEERIITMQSILLSLCRQYYTVLYTVTFVVISPSSLGAAPQLLEAHIQASAATTWYRQ